jgi:hypothetical protein
MLYGAAAGGVSEAVCADTKLASQRAIDSCAAAAAAAALPTAAVAGTYIRDLSYVAIDTLRCWLCRCLGAVYSPNVMQLSSFN